MTESPFASLASTANRPWLIAALAGVLVFIAGLWWLLRTDNVVLDMPSDAPAREEALQSLQAAGIEYRINGENVIEVPGAALAQARQLLGASDHAFPAPAGFELLDRNDYTLSDFSQRLNYQRALEGELARTLSGLREVRSARVHLSLPKSELFSAQKTQAKAAVTLQLKPGLALSEESAAGIREIIASAVEGLKPEQVALIDDHGTALAATAGNGALDQQVRSARRIEFDLERRVRLLLQDTWGIANPYVSVRADLNFDRITSVRDGAVPTSDAVGMLTREQVSDAAPSRDDGTATSTATREYVYTHERVETEFSSGRIARLNIAVALPAGYASLNPSQLEQIIAAAIGLQPERGDKLVVSLTPLLTATGAAATPLPPDSLMPPQDVSATADITDDATTPAALTDTADADRFAAFFPTLDHALMALFAAALLIVLYVAWRAPRNLFERMSPAQREQLLAELQQWLDAR